MHRHCWRERGIAMRLRRKGGVVGGRALQQQRGADAGSCGELSAKMPHHVRHCEGRNDWSE
jgi:hypothetical protein